MRRGFWTLFEGIIAIIFVLQTNFKASEALYDCPSIWYRLAECCIAHKQENVKEEKQVITEIGEGEKSYISIMTDN